MQISSYAPPGHKQYRNKRALKDMRASDRLFQRQLKAAKEGHLHLDDDSEVSRFLRKYNNAYSQKIKQDLRAMWKGCGCDMELDTCMVAREVAFKESVTEGEWLSMEQLVDTLKNPEHAANYAKAAIGQKLVQYDNMRKCKIYFYMKKLERLGSRKETSQEQTWRPKESGTSTATVAPSSSSVRKAINDASTGSSDESSDISDGKNKDPAQSSDITDDNDAAASENKSASSSSDSSDAPETVDDDTSSEEPPTPPADRRAGRAAAKSKATAKQAPKNLADNKRKKAESGADSTCQPDKKEQRAADKDRKKDKNAASSSSQRPRNKADGSRVPKVTKKSKKEKRDSKAKKDKGSKKNTVSKKDKAPKKGKR
eukprot:TRINITY_DN44575_c0_g1_i1.p1 TRINITY_DN44575_c0_g1~~TRINITY_DN44575_c0_g1_i1.p1  ORF type:complete len:388 (+),score=135.54 TRINITY_DN44575_c0_g1_i1:56-1165(+)